jgi:glycosyltransferase involved in cell wall biosynthesis
VTSRLPSYLTKNADPCPARAVGGPHFLFVGRLTARKRPVEVVEAFGLTHTRLVESTLTVVGDGPLILEVQAAARRVGKAVRVLGRREGAELTETYRECDVLVLPARREVWGLVVNEALAHGLFVITSDEVGSAYDLVTPETGVMVSANDLRALVPALVDTEGVDRSEATRRRRAEVVAACTPERMATDWAHATELALARSASFGAVPRRSRSRRGWAAPDTTGSSPGAGSPHER